MSSLHSTTLQFAMLAALSISPFVASAAVPAYQGGWVHDGAYAPGPLDGATDFDYRPILNKDSMESIRQAIQNGMRQITLNVGIDHLVTDRITGDTYSATFRSDSLNTMLDKVVEWNRNNPDLQVGVKIRLHAGTRQTRTVKNALGTVKVGDSKFNVQGTIPRHWVSSGTNYPFRTMYEAQMAAVAEGIAAFNQKNGNAIQAIIVPGNAFFYPEPFTIMASSRLATPGKDNDDKTPPPLAISGTETVNVNDLFRLRLKDGSDEVSRRTYRVTNYGPGTLHVTCRGKPLNIAAEKTSECEFDAATNGDRDRIAVSGGTAQYRIEGATNREKLTHFGLDGRKQLAYFDWLTKTAHDAFRGLGNVRVGIALNPYRPLDSHDGPAAKCLAVNIGSAWIAKWKGRAQVENYSYRTKYARDETIRPRGSGRSAEYDRIYGAMDYWSRKQNVVVGVQLARVVSVWDNWGDERRVWDDLMVDAGRRGWSFMEPAGARMNGYAENAWPTAYIVDWVDRKILGEGANVFVQNYLAAGKNTQYKTKLNCE